MSRMMSAELLPKWRERYERRGRQGRSRMLDEVCEQFGYSRKHAIKLHQHGRRLPLGLF